MVASSALISIHPEYVEKILLGDKRLEFRRRWAATPVTSLLIYATAPVKKVVAVVELTDVIRTSKTRLWQLAQQHGGGVSRRKLFAYIAENKEGVALKLGRKIVLGDGIEPSVIFGEGFRPPQSFRYVRDTELILLAAQIGDQSWP